VPSVVTRQTRTEQRRMHAEERRSGVRSSRIRDEAAHPTSSAARRDAGRYGADQASAGGLVRLARACARGVFATSRASHRGDLPRGGPKIRCLRLVLTRHGCCLMQTAWMTDISAAHSSSLPRCSSPLVPLPRPIVDGRLVRRGHGWFDANRRRNQAAELRLEYRSPSLTGGLRAVAATLATSDGSLFVVRASPTRCGSARGT
jgi:hypothetical protein